MTELTDVSFNHSEYRMRPEASAQIRFLTPNEGGRRTPHPGPWFGCPLELDGEYFDCRLQRVPPGPSALVPLMPKPLGAYFPIDTAMTELTDVSFNHSEYRMRPEASAQIRFLTPNEGGRRTPHPGPWFGCPLELDGEYFDCRLQRVPPGPIALGESFGVHIQFSRPDLVLPRLLVGKEFTLWDGHTIANGCVTELIHCP